MAKAIEDMKKHEEDRRLHGLALYQDDFIQRYVIMIPDDRRRDDFRRDLMHLIHLTYREAQEPLVKQMSEFVMSHFSTQVFAVESRSGRGEG